MYLFLNNAGAAFSVGAVFAVDDEHSVTGFADARALAGEAVVKKKRKGFALICLFALAGRANAVFAVGAVDCAAGAADAVAFIAVFTGSGAFFGFFKRQRLALFFFGFVTGKNTADAVNNLACECHNGNTAEDDGAHKNDRKNQLGAVFAKRKNIGFYLVGKGFELLRQFGDKIFHGKILLGIEMHNMTILYYGLNSVKQ